MSAFAEWHIGLYGYLPRSAKDDIGGLCAARMCAWNAAINHAAKAARNQMAREEYGHAKHACHMIIENIEGDIV